MPPRADTFEERPSHEQSASRVPQKSKILKKKLVSSYRGLQKTTLPLTLKEAAKWHFCSNKEKRPLISRQRKKKRESAGGRNKSVIEVETEKGP